MNLFAVQMRGELRKMFTRRRTYIGYGAFLILEVILLTVFQLEKSQNEMRGLLEQNGFSFDEYYSSQTVTYWVMSLTIFFLGGIYFALVSGDIVAKETEDGNMRLVLARPVSRLRVLFLKYLSVILYTISFVIFVGITGYIMAVVALGWDGGLFVWNPKMKVFAIYNGWWEGMARLALAALLIGVSMCTLSSFGFFFSCLRVKPAAATILALSVLFLDFVLQEFPFLQPYQEYFITYRMNYWLYSLENHLVWAKLGEGYVFLFGLNASLFVLGWMAFQLRDFKT